MNYSIKELERLSGIKAHTIRIWEKRYRLLRPGRTNGNIRLYTDQELMKLLNVVTLLENNWKISKISYLSEEEIRQEVRNCIISCPVNAEIQINELLRCTLGFDEQGFSKALSYNFDELGVRRAYLEIIYPFLNRVGILWQVADVHPAQEHFASNLIRRKIISAIDGLPYDETRKRPSFLIYLPEGEYHEIGLMLANYIVRSAGCRTCYLGACVPASNVIDVMESIQPDYLLTFYVTPRQPEEFVDPLLEIEAKFEGQSILVCGRVPKEIGPDDLSDKITILKQVKDLEAVLHSGDSRSDL
ncbi:MAG: MerR family transcriptional regulator [Bacteroidota bacterium]